MQRTQTLWMFLFLFACESGDPGAPGAPGAAGDPGARGERGPRGAPTSSAPRDQLLLPGASFYPEGIAASRDGSIFVGSLPTGEILRFAPGSSSASHFAAVTAAAGILADDARGKLYVCNNHLDFSAASIAELDLETGALLADHPLPIAPAFCNDLTLDASGNVYATESLQQKIVKLAAGSAAQGALIVWAEGAAFTTPANQFGLNGIAYDGEGHIFAGNYTTGTLHRIAIEPSGAAGAVQEVPLPRPLAGLDGFEKIDAATFLASEQFGGQLSKIVLTSSTAELEAIANHLDTPTTFAIFDESAWIVEGQLDHFLGYDPAAPALPFRVRRVPLALELPIGPSKIAGHWSSEGCEALPSGAPFGSITRDFAIGDTEWSLLLTFYADASCGARALESDIVGPYLLGERSAKVEGATEGDFGYRSIRFTAYDDATAAQLGSCGGGAWELGVAQEVGGTGCIGIAPKTADCPFDHDVVKVDGDRLFFGVRGGDMCVAENRPATLNPTPVIRR